MSRRAERRTGRALAPDPAAGVLAAAAAAFVLAACGGSAPWLRATGSSPGLGDVTRVEYSVYCEECRATYAVPGEGPRHTRVETRWRDVVLAEPGNRLSVSATVPEEAERRRATVAIRVEGEVVDADTLWRGRGRRTIAASHTVPGDPASRAR